MILNNKGFKQNVDIFILVQNLSKNTDFFTPCISISYDFIKSYTNIFQKKLKCLFKSQDF